MNCANNALRRPVITNGLACCLDPAVECSRRHVLVSPHTVEELIFRDNAISGAQKKREHIEHLWL